MADAVLGPLFENLNSLIQREFGLLWGVKAEVRKLSRTLLTIRAVLADAEVQEVKSKAVQNWLVKLKDAAYDAEDILEDWATDEPHLLHHHQAAESDGASRNYHANRVRDSFQSLFTSMKRLKFHYKIAKKMKEIRERFDEIAKEKSDFHLKEGLVDVEGLVFTHHSISPNRETSSISKEPQIYGRNADKENIVKMLLENMNNEHVISVCPIIGIGGLDKTTLAQFIYNDDRVQKHFEVRIWICVSDDFNVKRLLKEIVEVVTKSRFDHDNLDVIQDGVLEKVRGKKFLLVLDDVWSDKQDEWNMLTSSLTSGTKGSSIVVITRLETVASITGTVSVPYRLGGLSKDDCWSLFRYYAFGTRNELEKPKLVSIGQEIVKKCGGLPLAAKALGSLLRFKANERQWELIRDSEIWDVEEEASKESTRILPALRLSYNNLSPRARQCFAYCSLFPKDYTMSKEDLVYLWLANDLLHVRKMEPEDVGEDVFSELLLHSFFQDIKENEEDNTMTFKIHDLMHDLASSVMKREHSHVVVEEVGMRRNLTNNNIQDDEIRPRHLSITLSSLRMSPVVSDMHLVLQRHHLRTLFLFSQSFGELEMSLDDISTLSDLKFLRALRFDIWRCKMELLPLSFGNKLKHLRYLSLSRCNIASWQAESFRGMKSLQILDLSHNRNIKTLPHSMGMHFEHLRQLNLGWCDLSSFQAESFCGMKSLQILDLSHNRNIKTLPHSMGMHFEHLRQLNLGWCDLSSLQAETFRGMKNLQILDLSQNHHMQTLPDSLGRYWEPLRQLKLTKCGLSSLPAELFSSMKNLQFLDLSQNYWIRILPDSVGNLEHLRHLNLSRNSLLELLPESLGNLTELETLKLHQCEKLKMLPKSTSRLCNLRHLENEFCWDLSMPSGAGQLTRLENLNWWIAGTEGSDIQELRGLNLLSGSLNIKIKSTLSKETKPCHHHEELLINKKYLSKLDITFYRDCDYGDEGGAEQVLRILKPPANIEHLTIKNYERPRLPDWMQMKDPQSSFSRLTSIKFAFMENISNWSLNWKEKECLPALQSLSLIGCDQLKALPEELERLTTLKTLVLDGCGAFSVPQGFQKLTSLESLQITDCKRFMSLPQLQLLTNLKNLRILNCPELKFVFHGLHHLTSIERLLIRWCPGVVIPKLELDSLIALRGAISDIGEVVYQY